ERLLNELGIFHFGQIAAWTPGEVAWIGQYLAFPDRIAKDDWVGQATLLAMGAETGFQKSAERRRERRRPQREFHARMALATAAFDDPEASAAFDDGVRAMRADDFAHEGPVEEAALSHPEEDYDETEPDDFADEDPGKPA